MDKKKKKDKQYKFFADAFHEVVVPLLENMATKDDVKDMATKDDIKDLKKDILYELGGILESTGHIQEAANQYYKEIYQVDIGYKDVAAKIEKSYKPSPQA